MHDPPGKWVDFGRLEEPMQQTVIECLAQSPTARTEVSPAILTFHLPKEQGIQHNRQIVEEHFHLQEYGRRLLDIYQTVLDSEVKPTDPVDADRLLEQFLAPERFCLLRT
jgi:hypothetical protein